MKLKDFILKWATTKKSTSEQHFTFPFYEDLKKQENFDFQFEIDYDFMLRKLSFIKSLMCGL